MSRYAIAFAAASFLACSEFRVASDSADTGTEDEGQEEPKEEILGNEPSVDGGRDASTRPPKKDAATKDAAPACDGPCPPEVLASNINQGTVLTVDAKNVYYAVQGGTATGTVFQCPKTGCSGAPIELGPGYASGIVVAGGMVYWGDYAAGKLVACAVGGCAKQPTVIMFNQPSIKGVFTDGFDLYWGTDGTIRRCPRTNCNTATTKDIATGQGFVKRIAVDQGTALWVSPSNNLAYVCTGQDCVPKSLGPGTGDPFLFAGTAYWMNGPTKSIVRCSVSGCSGNPQPIGTSTQPRMPTADGKHVYWSDDFQGDLYRCPASGCTPGLELLASGFEPEGIALDGEYVYWTTGADVFRLHK